MEKELTRLENLGLVPRGVADDKPFQGQPGDAADCDANKPEGLSLLNCLEQPMQRTEIKKV